MELLFQIILILALLQYSSKAALFKHWGGMSLFACIAGLIAYLLYPEIITIESNVFEKLLSDRQSVSSFAVLVTIEAICSMLISIGLLDNLFSSKKKPLLDTLKFFPGILIVGAVFYFELQLFRHFAGIDFFEMALLVSFALTSGIFLTAFCIKRALPDDTSRFELIFLTNIMLLFLSVLLNAGLADYNASSYQADFEPEKLAVFIGITTAGVLIGYILYNIRIAVRRFRRDQHPPDAS